MDVTIFVKITEQHMTKIVTCCSLVGIGNYIENMKISIYLNAGFEEGESKGMLIPRCY